MGKGYTPPDYGAKKKPSNLRDRVMEPEKQRKAYEQRKERAVEMHIKNSLTKKLLDWFFIIAMLSILIQFVCQTAGVAERLGVVNYIPKLFLTPLTMVWHYDTPPTLKLGATVLPLPHIIMLVVYGVLYPILAAIHAVVSENRTFIPE